MSLEIVVGPMFSGKSTYALSYIRRQQSIGKKVCVIKPSIDTRYSNNSDLITHDKDRTLCKMWDIEIPLFPDDDMTKSDCIVFEESQFFDYLPSTINFLLLVLKKDILIVGLDGTYMRTPFGSIFDCIPLASKVTKLNALCSVCRDGTAAPYTVKLNKEGGSKIDVGGAEKYTSVCLDHLS